MSITLHDSTGLISGAGKVIIDSSSAWTDGRSIDFDRIRKYVASKPAKSSLVFDLETPSLLQFNAFAPGSSIDRVERDVVTAVHVLTVAKKERPDLDFTWYDALVEDESTILDGIEAKYRKLYPRNDGDDAWWASQFDRLTLNLDRLDWANDLLRELHAAQDVAIGRCYFSLRWVSVPGARARIIDWVWRRTVAMSNSEKPAMLLYKPNCQDGGGVPVYHDDAGIAADVSAFHHSGVKRVCLWRDQHGPADRITTTAKLIRKRVAVSVKSEA